MNNNVTFVVLFIGVSAILAGCTDGDDPDKDASGTNDTLAQVFVNEVMSSNASILQDEVGAFPDWIELWNSEDKEADISGWWVSDDLTDVFKWQVPAGTVIEPGGFLVLYADEDLEEGPMHVNFNLSAEGGDDVALFGPNALDNPVVDSIEDMLPLNIDWSHARKPDGGAFEVDDTPSPMEANN